MKDVLLRYFVLAATRRSLRSKPLINAVRL